MIICLATLAGCQPATKLPPSPTFFPATALSTSTPSPSPQPSTPTVETATSIPAGEEFILEFFETWNKTVISGEIDELLGFFAEEATLETVDYMHLEFVGKEKIQTVLEYWTSFGYYHLVDQYELSVEGDKFTWNLESDDEKAFCHGKVIPHGLEIVYL